MYINKTSILKGYHFLPNPLYRTFSTGGIRKKHKLYDIAIIGGGPTGNAMACALTSSPELSNKKIALIDPGKYDHVAAWEPPLNAYSNRTLQITSSSHKFLQGIGLWNYVMQERTQPYYRAFISDSVEGGRVILEPNTKTAGPVAYLVETKNLQRAFVRMLNDQKDKIDIIDRTKVTSISTEPGDLDWPIVHLSNSSTIQARLLIGADGYYSSVRKYSSIYSQTYDYQQHGLVANLILERTNQDAYERFLPSGPIALLPFPNAQANIVWSLTRDIVQKLKNLPEDLFVKMVNAAFALPSSDVEYLVDLIDQDGSCIDSQVDVEKEINWRWKIATKNSTLCENQPPRISSITPKSRTTFPLRMLNADRYIGERLALIGEAAHVMHPLAGLGLNMGLGDVETLSKVILKASSCGEDIGTMKVLQEYNSERYMPNAVTQGIIDKIWHTYKIKNHSFACVRSFGMDILDNMPATKSIILRLAT